MILDSLSGKVALVTGAASGIGQATARLLAENNVRLALVDVNDGPLEELARSLREQGKDAIAIQADLSQPGTADRAVDRTVETYGRLDSAMNIAGVSGRKPILEMTDDDWNGLMGINLYGTFSLCRAEARVMVPRKSGTIVNCSSVRAFSGVNNATHYTAAKAGIVGLTYALAIELKPQGVRVNVVVPAGTQTGMTTYLQALRDPAQPAPSSGAIMQPEQVARTIAFLASEDSDMLVGQAIGVTRYAGEGTGERRPPA